MATPFKKFEMFHRRLAYERPFHFGMELMTVAMVGYGGFHWLKRSITGPTVPYYNDKEYAKFVFEQKKKENPEKYRNIN